MRTVRFNPPPGWPLPPGWSPPSGWEPDPSWPPAPPGWPFWVEVPSEQPRGRGRLVAAGAAVVVLLVVLAVGVSQLVGTRPPASGSETTSEATGETVDGATTTSEEPATSDGPTIEVPSGESDEPAPELTAVDTAGGVEGVATAETGDCMMWDDIGATFPAVPCSEEHDAEVYAVFDIAGATDYPGEDAVNALANSECVARFEVYVGVRLSDSDLTGHYFTPTGSTWGRGDRQVLCVAYLEDGSTVTETFKDSER